ncbi:MAG: transposase [Rhodospirillales bacterium]|nr:transposase [Rhodospirillales bacterium]
MAAGPRRRKSEADRRRIVAESYQPGTSVALVARRNAVNANLVFHLKVWSADRIRFSLTLQTLDAIRHFECHNPFL